MIHGFVERLQADAAQKGKRGKKITETAVKAYLQKLNRISEMAKAKEYAYSEDLLNNELRLANCSKEDIEIVEACGESLKFAYVAYHIIDLDRLAKIYGIAKKVTA